MELLGRDSEVRRLNKELARTGSLSVIWGRRRVGKSRLLIEWCRHCDGLYAVAENSAPAVQRRHLASAVAERFPGFADIEYPTWRALLARLSVEADQVGWRGPFIVDELQHLMAADPLFPGRFQDWLHRSGRKLCVAVSGSSQGMMHRVVVDACAPPLGLAVESIALRPLRAGLLADVFEFRQFGDLVGIYALWGGMPRYWELAVPFGEDLDGAVDALVLDPCGPLHHEPEHLLYEETPPATSLRPLLDVVGSGARRLGEIAGRLDRPATSLARPIAALMEMGFICRELPFGSDPHSGKRSLYRIGDPFLRMWFRVVAPHRAALTASPPESRLRYWHRYKRDLEAVAWQELCSAAVPRLHESDHPIAGFGPFEPAQRFWHGNAPERDVVARSVDGSRLLVGEATRSLDSQNAARLLAGLANAALPGARDCDIIPVLFAPQANDLPRQNELGFVVDAESVFSALR
ncbi:MAG: hypothetical protein OXJ37_13055 [Bryobacterales bacterium]|nr:hypothetical protein [Bryobacterales bacterium]